MRTQIRDFRPSDTDQDRALDYWKGHGRFDLNMNDQIDAFIDHHKAHGKKMADWSRAWGTWFRNALRFNLRPKDAYKPLPKPFDPRGVTDDEWRAILKEPGGWYAKYVFNNHPHRVRNMSDTIKEEYGFT